MCQKPASSKLDAIAKMKCPVCRRGKLFTHPFYHPKHFSHMPERCPVCSTKFEPETGFYWGAMYISYAFTVAISVIVSIIISLLFNNLNINVYVVVVIAVLVLFLSLNLRLSRTIMIHFLSPYRFDPKWGKQQGE